MSLTLGWQYIKNNLRNEGAFMFSQVNENDICIKLEKLNSKKATGYDNIPPKLIKLGSECLAGPMAKLVNKSIETSTFSKILKPAEVTTVFKKNYALDKKNYKPISILPRMSNVFEGLLS